MRVARWATWGAAAGSAAVLSAPLGYRIGVAPLGLAFLLLAGGLLVISVSVGVLGARVARGTGLPDRAACAALVAALAVGVFPLGTLVSGWGAPPIHDITTDIENPPAFVAAVALNAPGRTDYEGPALAERQRAAYPDLRPAELSVAPADAFRGALAVVRRMGWELLATDPDTFRIEATDRSFWFGFEDDVVVRITAAGETGSRVDVRSLSRVGVGDLGVNAQRVREFLEALAEVQDDHRPRSTSPRRPPGSTESGEARMARRDEILADGADGVGPPGVRRAAPLAVLDPGLSSLRARRRSPGRCS